MPTLRSHEHKYTPCLVAGLDKLIAQFFSTISLLRMIVRQMKKLYNMSYLVSYLFPWLVWPTEIGIVFVCVRAMSVII